MFNCILTAYGVSTIIIWVVFWARINGLEKELNTYYYVPAPDDMYTKIDVICDTFSILILFVPIANFIFIIHQMLEDHLAVIGGIVEGIGAKLKPNDNKEDESKGDT